MRTVGAQPHQTKGHEPSTVKLMVNSQHLDILVWLNRVTRDWVGPSPHNYKMGHTKRGSRQSGTDETNATGGRERLPSGPRAKR